MNQDHTNLELQDIRRILDELIESLKNKKDSNGNSIYSDSQIFDMVNRLEDLIKSKKIKYTSKKNNE